MTVLNHAKRLDLDLEKVDNALVITDEQALKIGESINNQKPLYEKIKLEDIFDKTIKMSDKIIEKDKFKDQGLQNEILNLLKLQLEDKEKQISFLENQMQVKDKQIHKLNETLDNQQKLLYNQQSLALQSNEKIKILEIELQQFRDNKTMKTEYDIVTDNNKDSFYKDLQNNSNIGNSKSILSRFFKK